MSDIRRYPVFLCIGAQKAGTTTLHDALSQHPQIFLPKLKETHFFVREDRFQLGFDDYQQRYFSEATHSQLIGEIDPEYLFFPVAAPRIKQFLGERLKFIVILREPVSRAFSHYQMSQRRGLETLDFLTAIQEEPSRIQTDLGFRHFSYLSRSQYLKQIINFQKHFPNASFLFLLFEKDIQQNLNEAIRKVTAFLEVADIKVANNLTSNPASAPRFLFLRNILFNKEHPIRKLLGKVIPRKYKLRIALTADTMNQKKITTPAKLEPSIRKHLFEQYFMNELTDLERITNLDLSNWLPKSL